MISIINRDEIYFSFKINIMTISDTLICNKKSKTAGAEIRSLYALTYHYGY